MNMTKKNAYALTDGTMISFEQVKAMSDEEFWKTLPDSAHRLFTNQPELLKSFRLQAEGDFEGARQLLDSFKTVAVKTGRADKVFEDLMEVGKELTDVMAAEVIRAISAIEERAPSKPTEAEVYQMTPEQKTEVERFKSEGFNLHISYDMFKVLLTLMDDVHHMYGKVLATAEVFKAASMETKTMPVDEGIKQTEERHANWHTFEEMLQEQLGKAYPSLARPADEEHTLH